MIIRATGLLVLEVRNSNPNGDPDREGDPRQRPNGLGEISPVSVKRKIRDLIDDKEGPVWQAIGKGLDPDEFLILEKRGRIRKDIDKMNKNDFTEFQRTYWDGRVFGNTFLEERETQDTGGSSEGAKGQKKQGKTNNIRSGVVHFGVGLSVASIDIERSTFTNKAGVEEGKDRGMAPLGFRVVEHGVYTIPFFVNPTAGGKRAEKSGCEPRDVDLLCRTLPHIYSHTISLGRSMVEIRHAHFIEHASLLGSFSDFQMIDALTPRLRDGIEKPKRIDDYLIPHWDDVPEVLKSRAARYRDLVEVRVNVKVG